MGAKCETLRPQGYVALSQMSFYSSLSLQYQSHYHAHYHSHNNQSQYLHVSLEAGRVLWAQSVTLISKP